LHHEVERAVLFEVIDVRGEGRMRKRREHRRLAFGELDVFPGLRPLHDEALDGDRRARILIDAVEGRPLRAFAELTDDLVAPADQFLRRLERHTGGLAWAFVKKRQAWVKRPRCRGATEGFS